MTPEWKELRARSRRSRARHRDRGAPPRGRHPASASAISGPSISSAPRRPIAGDLRSRFVGPPRRRAARAAGERRATCSRRSAKRSGQRRRAGGRRAHAAGRQRRRSARRPSRGGAARDSRHPPRPRDRSAQRSRAPGAAHTLRHASAHPSTEPRRIMHRRRVRRAAGSDSGGSTRRATLAGDDVYGRDWAQLDVRWRSCPEVVFPAIRPAAFDVARLWDFSARPASGVEVLPGTAFRAP